MNQRGSAMLPIIVLVSLLGGLGVVLFRGTDDGMATQRYLREQQVIMDTQVNALAILRDRATCEANFAGQSVTAGSPDVLNQIVSSGANGKVFVKEGDVLDYKVVQLVSLRLYDYQPYLATGVDRFRGTINAEFGFASADGSGPVRTRNVLLAVELNGFKAGNPPPVDAIKTCVAVGVNSDLWQMTGAGDIYYAGRSVGVGTTTPQTNADPTQHNLQVAQYMLADDYYHPSDLRLKQQVQAVAGLDAIERLNGVHFGWNAGGAGYGVIAQNVESVFPEAVDSTGEFKRVDYEQLIAPLVESVRELAARNRDLRARIERLKN